MMLPILTTPLYHELHIVELLQMDQICKQSYTKPAMLITILKADY